MQNPAVNANDLIRGSTVLTITGSRCLHAEHVRFMAEVGTSCMIIQCVKGRIRICGQGLQMDYYTKDELQISGQICSVEFLDSGGLP